ncbi:MAG: Sec-independent protein translocase protein TatB [Pseudonocardia sp.]
MFENLGWGEILVLLVAGLFILGPERLPEAAAWLGRAINQVKGFATGARDQLRSELGPEFDELRKPFDELRQPLNELRGLRNNDPRRMVTRALFDDDPPVKPNGYAPPPGGSAGYVAPAPGSATSRLHPAAEPPRQLGAGERPPIDPDAT